MKVKVVERLDLTGTELLFTPKMMISMSLLGSLWTVSMLLMTVDGLLDNAPNCLDSCSNEVNCSIIQYMPQCPAESHVYADGGMDISGEPVDLQTVTRLDMEHQYVNLQWRPPKDGSYNYLKGYLVQVTVISSDHAHSDVTDTVCYTVMPVSTWQETHRKLNKIGGVSFHLNCIRSPASASLHIIIIIHSLPLRPDAPKLAYTTFTIRPGESHKSWNPQLKKWADTSDVMHLIIENPLREAHFYDVQILSARTGHVVFSDVFQASLGNRSQDNIPAVDQNSKPHFLVHGLSRGDNYTILMDVLDENRTHIPNYHSIETIPFSLNFSRHLQPVSATATQTLTPSNIILIVVGAAVAAAMFACLLVRGSLKSSTIRTLVPDPTQEEPVKFKLIKPALIPIYCNESDIYVGAVTSHVNLLRRYIDALYSSHYQPPCVFPICNSTGSAPPRANCKPEHSNVIIYLSPRLGKIFKSSPETCDSFSTVDIQCLENLKTLNDKWPIEKDADIHLVTFDCFKKAEIRFLDDLTTLISPRQHGLDVEPQSLLRLTKWCSNGWRLDNLEIILLRLLCLREFPAYMARSLEGWERCSEAKEVEQLLCHLWESRILNNLDTVSSVEQEKSSVAFGVNCAHYSNGVKRSVGMPSLSNPESVDEKLEDSHVRENHQKLYRHPGTHLRRQSRGQEFQPDPDIAKSCQLKVNLPDRILNPPSKFRNNDYLLESVHKMPRSVSQQLLTSLNVTSCHNSKKLHFPDFAHRHETNKRTAETRKPESASYKTKLYTRSPNRLHPSDLHYLESDSLLNLDVLSGQNKNQNSLGNKIIHDNEEVERMNKSCDFRGRYRIIPPSLSYSSCTTMGSICEQIDKINDHCSWSESSLS